jgi:type II secretory ATPase GspE/PulE/Tfp pilus assembly ATPase PilB-like protein
MGTPQFRQAIAHGLDIPALTAAAKEQGYRTMLEDGAEKVRMGWTTPEEVLRAVYSAAVA